MPGHVSPDDLFSWMDDIEQRVRILETGDTGLEDATGVTLSAGWTTIAGYPATAVRKEGRIAVVRTALQNTSGGTLSAITPLFTLPTGFRPDGSIIVAAYGNPGALRVDINSLGVASLTVGSIINGGYLGFTTSFFTN